MRVDVEIVRPDGTVWMRLSGWEDWRFHWPGRYRDVFRQPRDHLIGEPLAVDRTGVAVAWLAPPADMGRPVWRDVLEQTQLGPAERLEHLAMGGSEEVRSRRLWGRIAAKEAARRLWQAEGRAPTYPADLAIVHDRSRPILTRLDAPDDRSLPSIVIDDAEGVAVAIAVRDPNARPGIAVGPIREGDHPGGERSLLSRWSGPARAEWSSRFERPRGGDPFLGSGAGRGPPRRCRDRHRPRAPRHGADNPRRHCATRRIHLGLDPGRRSRTMMAVNDRAAILRDVNAILVEHLGVPPSTTIDEETRFFADLGLASIDAVVLGEAIQQHYRRPLPFDPLMAEIGRRTDRDLAIGELVAFLGDTSLESVIFPTGSQHA